MYGGVTHDCASIVDSNAKGTSCSHDFSSQFRTLILIVLVEAMQIIMRNAPYTVYNALHTHYNIESHV